MNTVIGILMVMAVIGIALASYQAVWGNWKHRSRGRVLLANSVAEGTHEKALRKLTDAAISTRFLLVKKGSDADHIAVAGATDLAYGVVNDEASAAEEEVSVQLLSKGATKKLVASEAVTAGVAVYQAASGKVATTGTRCVGIAQTAAAADGDVIEVQELPAIPNPAGYTLMYAGIRTWAAGAVTSEGFTVTGVLSTDLVLATPIAVAGAGLLQKVVPTANTLTATTSAAWANGDKYSYQVWRAA